MSKKLLPAFVLATLACTGLSVAQTTVSQPPPSGTTMEKTETRKVKVSDGKSTKTKKTTVVGTVKKYDVGKSIVIATSKSHSKSFDLDASGTMATVDPAVTVGSKAKLTDAKGDDGNHTITVEAYTAAAKHHKAATRTTTKTSTTTTNS